MKPSAPPRNFSHHDMQPSSFKPLYYLYKEALMAGLYLYNKETKKWWTPEQFYTEYSEKELTNYQVSQMQENLVVRDPKAGIKAANKQLDEMELKMQLEIKALRNKLEEFSLEVLTYYQSKKPDKLNY